MFPEKKNGINSINILYIISHNFPDTLYTACDWGLIERDLTYLYCTKYNATKMLH